MLNIVQFQLFFGLAGSLYWLKYHFIRFNIKFNYLFLPYHLEMWTAIAASAGVLSWFNKDKILEFAKNMQINSQHINSWVPQYEKQIKNNSNEGT